MIDHIFFKSFGYDGSIQIDLALKHLFLLYADEGRQYPKKRPSNVSLHALGNFNLFIYLFLYILGFSSNIEVLLFLILYLHFFFFFFNI